ncbi:MAG TPA: hypothetical protein VKB76_16245, partial [Ktedonobacterales bacterium]|nr:hypothetical protein [Ktedonobacterales bacterium]
MIRQALRGHRSPIDAQTVWRQLHRRIAIHRGGFMLQTSKIAWISGLALFAIVIIAFVAVFALQPSHHATPITSASPTPTTTATAAPTATATATPEPTLTTQQFASCFGTVSEGGIQKSDVVRIGDIALASSIGDVLPQSMLPEGVSSPYKLSGDPSNHFAPSFVGEADPYISNPYTSSKIYFQICNLSTSTTY